MAKISKAGRCVHCLKEVDKITADHILPRAWYPKSDDTGKKITAPSCLECNRELGIIEEQLLTVLGLCLDPQSEMSTGIPERVLRSLNPEYAKDEKDKNARKQKRQGILSRIKVTDVPPISGILPGFGVQEGLDYSTYAMIECDSKLVERFCIKEVRCLAHYLYSRYITEEYAIEPVIPTDKKVPGMRWELGEGEEVVNLGDSYIVKRWEVREDPICGYYSIEIWRQLFFIVSVLPKTILDTFKSNGT